MRDYNQYHHRSNWGNRILAKMKEVEVVGERWRQRKIARQTDRREQMRGKRDLD